MNNIAFSCLHQVKKPKRTKGQSTADEARPLAPEINSRSGSKLTFQNLIFHYEKKKNPPEILLTNLTVSSNILIIFKGIYYNKLKV